MPSPSHHVELALYADDTAIIATSRKPTLLVSYLESYPNDLQRWLSEWRIAINVSKSTAIIFARVGRRFIQPRPATLRGNNRMGRQNLLSGVTLDTRHTWSPHIDQVRKRTAQRMGRLCPLLNRKSDLSVRNGVLLYKQIIRPMWIIRALLGGPWTAPMSAGYRCRNSSVFALLLEPPGNRQIHEDLGFQLFCRPHQSPDCELRLKVS